MIFDNNFNNVHDLVDCLNRGCEVEFLYNNKKYSITHVDEGISVMEFYNEDSEKTYSDAKKVLEYKIDGKLLKDIIPEMKIIDRSFWMLSVLIMIQQEQLFTTTATGMLTLFPQNQIGWNKKGVFYEQKI